MGEWSNTGSPGFSRGIDSERFLYLIQKTGKRPPNYLGDADSGIEEICAVAEDA